MSGHINGTVVLLRDVGTCLNACADDATQIDLARLGFALVKWLSNQWPIVRFGRWLAANKYRDRFVGQQSVVV